MDEDRFWCIMILVGVVLGYGLLGLYIWNDGYPDHKPVAVFVWMGIPASFIAMALVSANGCGGYHANRR